MKKLMIGFIIGVIVGGVGLSIAYNVYEEKAKNASYSSIPSRYENIVNSNLAINETLKEQIQILKKIETNTSKK